MTYLKKSLAEDTKDMLRVNLSAREDKLSPDPVCDFCGGDRPICVYASHRMSTGEEIECWRWCACVMCSALVDSEKFDALRRRVAARLSRLLRGGGARMNPAIIAEAVAIPMKDFLTNVVKTDEPEAPHGQ